MTDGVQISFTLSELPCRLCGEPVKATSLFYFSDGCVCAPDHLQALCPQHAISAEPIGSKGLIAGFNPWEDGVRWSEK